MPETRSPGLSGVTPGPLHAWAPHKPRDDDPLPWLREDRPAEPWRGEAPREPGYGAQSPPPSPDAAAPGGEPADASPPDDVPPAAPPVEERAGGPFPATGRVILALIALAVALWYAAIAASFFERGLVASAGVAFLQGFILGGLFGGIALVPSAMQRLLGRISVIDLRRGSHLFAITFLVLAMALVLGNLDSVADLEARLVGEAPERDVEVTGQGIWIGLVFNTLVLLVPPIVFVAIAWGRPLAAAMRAVGLKSKGIVKGNLIGMGLAILILIAYVLVASLVIATGVEPDTERVQDIMRAMTLPLAFAIAVVAGVTEEVFFRGFLQPRIGLFWQAVVFSLAHLSYLSVMQLVVTFVLGLAFGLMYKRTGNLWVPIGAHFAFNFIMLAGGMYAQEFEETAGLILPFA